MKNKLRLVMVLGALAISMVGCGGKSQEVEEVTETEVQVETEATKETEASVVDQGESQGTVSITDINGQVEVPVNPQRIVALDNRTFETLDDWGVEILAGPIDLMSKDLSYVSNPEVGNVGNHKEPDLELIAAANPDLVIIGQRFASHEDTIRDLVPEAAIINLNFDVSAEAGSPGDNLVNGLKSSTESLGKIFQKEAEAAKLIEDFEKSIEAVKASYNGEDTVMAVNVSGGNIGYSAPGHGRVWGPMFEVFGWKPALEVEDSSSDHKGDDISVEAIAESNPDWLFVLDRDAGTGDQSIPAADVISGSPALASTKAVQEDNIVYAPNDTYVNESIQTYIELFTNIGEALKK